MITVSSGLRTSSYARCIILMALISFGSLLASCSAGAPEPKIYVLGNKPQSITATQSQMGLPIVEIRAVTLPNYLDTTDLVSRDSENQITSSHTGRWGERLSVGFTRAFTTSLAGKLPTMSVTAVQPIEPPVQQIFLDIDSFEATSDSRVVLAARWIITDGSARKTLSSEHISVTEPIIGTGDEAIVAAMTTAIDNLAGQVAAAVES